MSANDNPTIGRIVIYRSRTGSYSVPAIVNCTVATIFAEGVAAGHVPPLTDEEHVHLTVFTPGKQGRRRPATDLSDAPYEAEGFVRGENQGGSYQEWDVPRDDDGVMPGSWSWPARLGGTS